jgi:uncharacterized membrane protein YphA (DoxX/SURF4 family)
VIRRQPAPGSTRVAVGCFVTSAGIGLILFALLTLVASNTTWNDTPTSNTLCYDTFAAGLALLVGGSVLRGSPRW